MNFTTSFLLRYIVTGQHKVIPKTQSLAADTESLCT